MSIHRSVSSVFISFDDMSMPFSGICFCSDGLERVSCQATGLWIGHKKIEDHELSASIQ